MRATVTIEKDILDELVDETGQKTKVSAVKEVISQYMSQKKREKIMAMKGKLKFDRTADELRHNER